LTLDPDFVRRGFCNSDHQVALILCVIDDVSVSQQTIPTNKASVVYQKLTCTGCVRTPGHHHITSILKITPLAKSPRAQCTNL